MLLGAKGHESEADRWLETTQSPVMKQRPVEEKQGASGGRSPPVFKEEGRK